MLEYKNKTITCPSLLGSPSKGSRCVNSDLIETSAARAPGSLLPRKVGKGLMEEAFELIAVGIHLLAML